MFNRGRDPGDGEDDLTRAGQDEGDTDPASAGPEDSAAEPDEESTYEDTTSEEPRAGTEESRSLEEMMRRLDEMASAGAAARSASFDQLAEEASTHAGALRATLNAQKEAQRMLALATRVRGEASAQAEQILLEAKSAAARVKDEAERQADLAREEMTEWAGAQRRALEQGVADVLEGARRDADSIRADALRNAMTEAERTAQRYVERATDAGQAHAEAIRTDARQLLTETQTAVGESERMLHRFADEVTTFMISVQRQFDALRELSNRAEERVAAAAVIDLDFDLEDEEDLQPAGTDAAVEDDSAAASSEDTVARPRRRVLPPMPGVASTTADTETEDEELEDDEPGAEDLEDEDLAEEQVEEAPATEDDEVEVEDEEVEEDEAEEDEVEDEAEEEVEDEEVEDEDVTPTAEAEKKPPRLPQQRRPLGSLFQPPESDD